MAETLTPAQEQMILNSPLYKARMANPEIQRLLNSGGSGKVKLVDSAGTEWTVTVEHGRVTNSSMGHPIRNSLIGLAAAAPGIGLGLSGGAAPALGTGEASTSIGTTGLVPGLTGTAEVGLPSVASNIPTIAGTTYGTGADMAGTAALPHVASTVPQAGLNIGKIVDSAGNVIRDLGRVSGGLENTEQANRIDKGNLTQRYDQLMLNAAANRRTDESDALKKLAITDYLKSGGSQFTPPTFQLNGQMRTAPDLGYGPRPTSDAQKTGASTLEEQMLTRLQPGGSYTPMKPDYLNRGKLETVGQAGDIIGGYLGTLQAGGGTGTPPYAPTDGTGSKLGKLATVGKDIWNVGKTIASWF